MTLDQLSSTPYTPQTPGELIWTPEFGNIEQAKQGYQAILFDMLKIVAQYPRIVMIDRQLNPKKHNPKKYMPALREKLETFRSTYPAFGPFLDNYCECVNEFGGAIGSTPLHYGLELCRTTALSRVGTRPDEEQQIYAGFVKRKVAAIDDIIRELDTEAEYKEGSRVFRNRGLLFGGAAGSIPTGVIAYSILEMIAGSHYHGMGTTLGAMTLATLFGIVGGVIGHRQGSHNYVAHTQDKLRAQYEEDLPHFLNQLLNLRKKDGT